MKKILFMPVKRYIVVIVVGLALAGLGSGVIEEINVDETSRVCAQQIKFSAGMYIGDTEITESRAIVLSSAANLRSDLTLRCGVSSAMTAGKVTVLNSGITANSKILVTPSLQADALPMGSLAVDSQTAGWGFEICSSSNTDTCVANWIAIEP
jgi:hypothetical protein